MHNDFLCAVVCIYVGVCDNVCAVHSGLCEVNCPQGEWYGIVEEQTGILYWLSSAYLSLFESCVSLDATRMLPWVKSPEQHQ